VRRCRRSLPAIDDHSAACPGRAPDMPSGSSADVQFSHSRGCRDRIGRLRRQT
jgi:hypothetical protein